MLFNLNRQPKIENFFWRNKNPRKPCYISEHSAENLLAQVLVLQESLNKELLKGKSITAQSLLQETDPLFSHLSNQKLERKKKKKTKITHKTTKQPTQQNKEKLSSYLEAILSKNRVLDLNRWSALLVHT